MPSVSSLLIAALWSLSVWGAIQGASEMPLSQDIERMSPLMVANILLMPILFFGAVAFWGRPQSPFYHPKLAQFVNFRYGANSLESFLVRLKPLLMFGTVAVLHGSIGLWRSRGATQEAYSIYGFIVSGGLGFAVAHVVLYLRKAVGVFPTWTIEHPVLSSAIAKPERKTLREALRGYWWTLIGVAIFPVIFFAGGEFFGIPFEFFVLPFLGVSFLAGWPYLSGRAPYSFWLVAMFVWLVGGVLAVGLLYLVHAATGLTLQ